MLVRKNAAAGEEAVSWIKKWVKSDKDRIWLSILETKEYDPCPLVAFHELHALLNSLHLIEKSKKYCVLGPEMLNQ